MAGPWRAQRKPELFFRLAYLVVQSGQSSLPLLFFLTFKAHARRFMTYEERKRELHASIIGMLPASLSRSALQACTSRSSGCAPSLSTALPWAPERRRSPAMRMASKVSGRLKSRTCRDAHLAVKGIWSRSHRGSEVCPAHSLDHVHVCLDVRLCCDVVLFCPDGPTTPYLHLLASFAKRALCRSKASEFLITVPRI